MVKKKIAFFISSMDIGGAEKTTLAMIEQLIHLNFQVTLILTVKRGELIGSVPQDCDVTSIDITRSFQIPFKLWKCLQEHRIEVLVSNFWKLNLCASVVKLIMPKLRLVLVEHSPPSQTSTSPVWLYRPLTSILYRCASRVVAVSNSVKQDVIRCTVALKDKIIVLYNPVSIERNSLTTLSEEEPKCTGRGVDLIFIGRLEPEKNVELILDAIKILSAKCRKIDIVGDGSLRSSLEKKAIDIGIQDKVNFLGFKQDITEALCASDILVLSSDMEGLPTVVIEALICGKGVAVIPIPGGINEILMDGRYGTVGENRTPLALAKAICAEADRYKTYASQKEGADKFSPKVVAQRFVKEIIEYK